VQRFIRDYTLSVPDGHVNAWS